MQSRPQRRPTGVGDLRRYRERRNFQVTPEPAGRRTKPRLRAARFVVQKHDATRLHYDFRLEVDGVLKSWAVPKGPSTDPREKRLAMPTEDHPLDYIDFEGVIPEGNYGAGPVIVWDTGTYENRNRDRAGKTVPMGAVLAKGHASFALHGKKLEGAYALTRVAAGPKPRWLLVKMRDAAANLRSDVVAARPESSLSGRTIEEVAESG
jgi:DNA ligase D-like protein (predicted 3'-phosphoesterase)